jgi:two-component system sensor histidine kinase BaeS
MTLRQKFLSALIGMIFFMSIIFAGISLYSISNLVSHSSTYISQSYVEQWEQLLVYYYQQNRDWAGVQDYIQSVTSNPAQNFSTLFRDTNRILVFDNQKNLVAGFQERDPRGRNEQIPPAENQMIWNQMMGIPMNGGQISEELHPVTVEGQVVGYYWLDVKRIIREGYLARGIASVSVIQGLLIGFVVTSLTALFLGAFLSKRFTVPLRRLIEAVKSVGQGDLTQRLDIKGKDEIASLGGAFNRMAEQLCRNEEVRRNMVADIAHELRTPLAVILGKLESIQEGILPQTPETLLPIQDETIRLIRLVRDLQQLSLAEAGKLPLSFQSVDLRKLINKIYEQFAYEFEERHLQTEISGQVPAITADPDRLTQVFVNLIGNALLHTPAGGTIRVSLDEGDPQKVLPQSPGLKEQREGKPNFLQEGLISRIKARRPTVARPRAAAKGRELSAGERADNLWVRVVVEDSGEGIPEQELEHIFDRFYRVTKARERESGGTGLGLAIAKEFVLAHGGQITVQSTLEQGTRFTIWLRQRPLSET